MTPTEQFIDNITKALELYHKECMKEAIKRGILEARKKEARIWKTK